MRSTNSPSMSLGVMVVDTAAVSTWFPDSCTLLKDKTSDDGIWFRVCTLSPEDDAVLEDYSCRVSFSNLCLSCIFKRSNYCAAELVASLWSCMGRNEWIDLGKHEIRNKAIHTKRQARSPLLSVFHQRDVLKTMFQAIRNVINPNSWVYKFLLFIHCRQPATNFWKELSYSCTWFYTTVRYVG